MSTITPQFYINTLSYLTLGVASVCTKVVDPWVLSGVINQQNTEFPPYDIRDGVVAERAGASNAIEQTSRTVYEPTGGHVIRKRSSVSVAGKKYVSRDLSDNTKGELLDVSVMNRLLYSAKPNEDVDYLVTSIASAGIAVYQKMQQDRLAMIFGNQYVKVDAENTPAHGSNTSFDTDCPHAPAIQVVDLTGSLTDAEKGKLIHQELLAAARPLRAYNPWAIAEFHLPEEVWEQYTYNIDAAVRSAYIYDYSFRRDDVTKSYQTTATYGKSYTLINMGPGSKFPQTGAPATAYSGLITVPGALGCYFNEYTAGQAASMDGSQTLASMIGDVGGYINTITQTLASERGSYNFLSDLAASDTSPGMWAMMQQGNFGGDALFNILHGVLAKLPYGTTDAMHYFYEVSTAQAVLRKNPALMRKWSVPFALSAAPASYSVTASTTGSPSLEDITAGVHEGMKKVGLQKV